MPAGCSLIAAWRRCAVAHYLVCVTVVRAARHGLLMPTAHQPAMRGSGTARPALWCPPSSLVPTTSLCCSVDIAQDTDQHCPDVICTAEHGNTASPHLLHSQCIPLVYTGPHASAPGMSRVRRAPRSWRAGSAPCWP